MELIDQPPAPLPLGPASKQLSRTSKVLLPADRKQAVGQALAFVQGQQSFDSVATMDELARRVASYTDPAGPEALRDLAEHMPLLEALFLKFAAMSAVAKSPDHAAKLLRMALQAQAAFTRTLTVVQGLALQQQGHARVSVDVGDG